ncbi:MAG: right-handed parallel beta-helix repeat-containing protein [Candidatus Bathyarchaeota archaeon]|nr:NosD domain-containing protein [Candidatus Bathyarchaeum tardum]WGM89763.1 MAG: NosD domain-containing protein [Candidatus Bathyarchaeum tardum]WNZ30143.1 MAG: right-handed parallel beta-helix repeat-containing protein [Candidatus Bathyarchaeota archaeon]
MNEFKTTFILLLLISVLALFPQTKAQPEPKMIVVPDDYNSIQQAVDAADDGDTVFVKEGTYNGSVVIDKMVSLVGENKEKTKIVGNWELNGTAVLVQHDNVTISNFTIESVVNSISGRGIHLLHVRNCKVSNCIFSEHWIGIWLYGASENIIENNHMNGTRNIPYSKGIKLQYSDNNTIQGNSIEDYIYGYGIVINSSTTNNLRTNLVSNSLGGIWCCTSADNNTITSNQITITRNIFLRSADNIILGSYGLKIQASSNNLAESNSFMDTANAVQIISSSFGNIIKKNHIINSIYCGLGLADDASNNIIVGNKIAKNKHGIEIKQCTNNKLSNNEISGNKNNIWVNGTILEHYIQDIDSSNTVDGKPVYYLVNLHNATVPTDAGQVTLVNCSNITVTDAEISNNYNGLFLAYTTNCTITKTVVINNYYGVKLYQSTNNSIVENNIKHNYWAIWLGNSTQNNITNNNIQENYKHGLLFFNASSNTITGNNIENNWIGAGFVNCSNNVVYNNNFIKNIDQQVKIEKTSKGYIPILDGMQIFDNGPQSGGNYWSDYNGTDKNNDGIGDTQYLVSEYRNNTDKYPLMTPIEVNVIPEFSFWAILPLFVVSTAVLIVFRNKIQRRKM